MPRAKPQAVQKTNPISNAKKMGVEDFLRIMPYLDDELIANLILASPDYKGAIEQFLPDDKEPDYPIDPVEFIEKTLDLVVWGKIKEICESVIDRSRR